MTAQGDTTMKFTPLYDRVLVKRVEEEARSAGGIIIPDSAKEKPLRGKVLAAGKGKLTDDGKLRTLAVKEGDTVLFGKSPTTGYVPMHYSPVRHSPPDRSPCCRSTCMCKAFRQRSI